MSLAANRAKLVLRTHLSYLAAQDNNGISSLILSAEVSKLVHAICSLKNCSGSWAKIGLILDDGLGLRMEAVRQPALATAHLNALDLSVIGLNSHFLQGPNTTCEIKPPPLSMPVSPPFFRPFAMYRYLRLLPFFFRGLNPSPTSIQSSTSIDPPLVRPVFP
jgi:hypothetical protein